MEQQGGNKISNDDFYYHSSNKTENVADSEALTAQHENMHFQSIDSITQEKQPASVRGARIVKKLTTVLMSLTVILALLAVATHGNIFFFDRVEGVVTEKERIPNVYSRRYTIRYNITIQYTYKDHEYTMKGKSANYKQVGQKVYVCLAYRSA